MTSIADTAAPESAHGIVASGIGYLTGAFAPVDTEVTAFDLPVRIDHNKALAFLSRPILHS